ncbi:MAG: hypothetical protein B0D91_04870 [Oceanospirillales bacterium LUC14_002_19_P2]|nr:MAG: hypothetical protein B0D91_04870 [Oceanospirillales bacterium LUC14_002_19_P2]
MRESTVVATSAVRNATRRQLQISRVLMIYAAPTFVWAYEFFLFQLENTAYLKCDDFRVFSGGRQTLNDVPGGLW